MSNSQSIVQIEPQTMARVESRQSVRPPCDVYENVDEYLVVADLPGVAKEDLTIQMEGEEMIIEAHRSGPALSGKVLSAEYVAADYRRRFALPVGVEGDKVQAELRDGVLRIHLPKSDAVKPRQIPIH